MFRFAVLPLTILSMLSSTHLHAQDLLGSTGSTTRSYSYVEVQYLPDLEGDLPFLASVVVDITDSLSVRGEYFKQNFSFPLNDFGDALLLDGESLSIGLLYHQPLAMMADSDWVAGLSLGRVQVEGETTDGAFSAEVSSNFQEGYLGVRRTMSETIEAEAGLNVLVQEGDNEFTGDLKLVIRVRPSIDVALAINEIGETDLFGIGLRYTW